MNRSAVPPPVTKVLDAAEAWLPRRMAAVERRLGELVARAGRRARRRGRGDARRRRQAPAPDAGPALRRSRGRTTARSAPRPRSSSSTWRPWSTTTSSTPPRCGAASPTVVARAGRATATAVGDLLFSRAFAELVAGDPGDGRRVRAARRRLGRRSPRASLPSAATPSTLDDQRRALPRALPAEDRAAVRVRLPDRRRVRATRRRRRAAARRSGARSASPSSSSTTCSTSPGPPSAPARRAAPTCSTAP